MRALVLLFFLFFIGFAHPHFFIDSKLKIEKNIIKSEWFFDRLNSRVLLFDFDKNRNKIFDKEEKEEFIKTHFLGLEKNNYNIFLSSDDEIKVEPKNIDVVFYKKRVKLSFDIEFSVGDVFTMCTMDEKIYMAYKLIDLDSFIKVETQNSEYDYCVGVVE